MFATLRQTIMTGILLVGGLVWLAHSMVEGARSGSYSDIHRQWVVSQYIKLGIDPYRVAHEILRETYGPATGDDRVRLGQTRIWAVAAGWTEQSTIELPPGLPPPEATYPPSTLVLFMPVIGFLPESFVYPVAAVANGLLLIALVFLGRSWLARNGLNPPNEVVLLAFALLWPPLQLVFAYGQFALVVLVSLLAYLRYKERSCLVTGCLLALMMIKPSMGLLFLLIPFVAGRWMAIIVAGLLHGVGIGVMALWLGVSPVEMMGDWLGACRYLLQGAYTLQEVWNRLGIENTPWFTLVVLAYFAAILGWLALHRKADEASAVGFLAFANLAWTYHERPDFSLLLLPLAVFVCRHAQAGGWRFGAGVLVAGAIGVSMLTTVYGGEAAWTHAVRWIGRFAILAGFAWTVAEVAIRHRRDSRFILTRDS
jgi:hypothetical protein